MSVFVNARDNASPLSNAIVKIKALWLLSLIGIRGKLIVDEVNILTISLNIEHEFMVSIIQ